VKFLSLTLLIALLTLTATGQTETVYKLKDESGATVYSDRQNLQGTTEAGTIQLAPEPSAEDRQAAEQRAQSMQRKSDEMQETRLSKEKQRNEEREQGTSGLEEIESSGVEVVDPRRRDPKARIPLESRDGGEHPVYQPNKRPIHIAPRPTPRLGR